MRKENGQFAKGNKIATGRPARYSNPEQLSERIRDYFASLKGEWNPEAGRWVVKPSHPTVTGLARYLGFKSRTSLQRYKNKEPFSEPIKEALLAIEDSYEQLLFSNRPTGAIFALKNFGWNNNRQSDQARTRFSVRFFVYLYTQPVKCPIFATLIEKAK